MYQITRRIEFDAGHRVLGHEGKCAHLHGHRYRAHITVSAPSLDTISRVIDFSVVKKLIGGWVDEHWDHNLLLNANDPLWAIEDDGGRGLVRLHGRDPFIIPGGENPTAEIMAKVLFYESAKLLHGHHLSVERVRLYETPNCWADYYG